MSFPHRTAFYLPENMRIGYHTVQEDRIITPEEANNISDTLENCTITDKLFVDSDSNVQMYVDEIENWIEPKPNAVPLAFTGLNDSQDNEIYDGHIVGNKNDKGTYPPAIVIYDRGTFSIKFENGVDFLSVMSEKPHDENVEILGHALTDPELVPDFFDVEAYFNE